MSDPTPELACVCEDPAARYTEFDSRQIPGYDETNGRFGEVFILRCHSCERYWLQYFVEYQGFTASGRWGRGLVDGEMIQHINTENALSHLHALPWYIRGGSYWGKSDRISGPTHWGL